MHRKCCRSPFNPGGHTQEIRSQKGLLLRHLSKPELLGSTGSCRLTGLEQPEFGSQSLPNLFSQYHPDGLATEADACKAGHSRTKHTIRVLD